MLSLKRRASLSVPQSIFLTPLNLVTHNPQMKEITRHSFMSDVCIWVAEVRSRLHETKTQVIAGRCWLATGDWLTGSVSFTTVISFAKNWRVNCSYDVQVEPILWVLMSTFQVFFGTTKQGSRHFTEWRSFRVTMQDHTHLIWICPVTLISTISPPADIHWTKQGDRYENVFITMVVTMSVRKKASINYHPYADQCQDMAKEAKNLFSYLELCKRTCAWNIYQWIDSELIYDPYCTV